MIDLDRAMQKFYTKHPDRTIVSAIDYDTDWFLFAAVKDPETIDYDSPFYAVNKESGDVRTYSPVDDLDAYLDAVQNRSIDLNSKEGDDDGI